MSPASTPTPCRLVFVIRDLGRGGAQRQLVALARGLTSLGGWEVTVVHFYPGAFEADLRAAGVRTVCVGKKHRWDLAGFFLRLVRCVRAARPDVVHGYLNEGNLMALMLKPFCGFPKVVWGLRDSQTDAHLWGWLGRLSFWLNVRLSRFADLIIPNSRAGKDYYARQGYPQKKMAVVPNGIDAARFSPAIEARPASSAGVVFGIVGRLHPMKDHATFLQAAALAAAQVPGLKLVIVGSGDAAYVQSLHEQAAALGLADAIAWLPAQDDMPALYARLDCLVSASQFGEGFSNVIGEAMAAGRPCIATDVGDSAWLVDDPACICAAADPAALADRMIRLARLSPAERLRLGARARQRILDHFTLERLVEKTAGLLRPQPRPLRVCFFTTGLGTGGAEMMLWQLATRLDPARFTPTVISLTPGGKYLALLREAGIRVETLDMPPGKPTPKALWRLLKYTWQLKPQVLMGWMYHGCLAATLARGFLLFRAPMIWNIRQSLYDLALEKRGSAMVIRLLARIAWLVRKITYNSQVSARQHEAAGYPAAKTVLIANGFDTLRWRPGPPPEPLEITASFRIGRFGRYTEMKDFPTFLEAAALITREVPDVQFILAGTGVDESNTALTTLVDRLGLAEKVQLLGERNDLPALTASLDLAVSSSAFGEGFPNVVGEAMACAVPVVATDIGDTSWVVGDTAPLVPARNPQAMAQACLKLIHLPAVERQALGQAGRERIETCFSLRAVVADFGTLILSRGV